LVGVAVNVIRDPRQKGFADAAIVRLSVKLGLTVIVTVLLVAGFPVGQTALEVSTQVTISPLTGVYV
jgi:hypothetical protein